MRERWKRDRIRQRDAQLRAAVHGTARTDTLEALSAAATVRVDARGLFCPEPVIRIQEAARSMSPGEIVEVAADDAGVEVDIPAWCMCTGNEYLGIIKESGVYRVLVRKA